MSAALFVEIKQMLFQSKIAKNADITTTASGLGLFH